jgi:hypothetical protein
MIATKLSVRCPALLASGKRQNPSDSVLSHQDAMALAVGLLLFVSVLDLGITLAS